MKRRKSAFFQGVAIIGLAGAIHVAHATTWTVNAISDNYTFSPTNITINVGDTITWSGLDNAHNVTGLTPQDQSDFCGQLSSMATETSCSHTFMVAGSFPYECTIHGPCCGMTGLVTVVAVTAPAPTVSITSPLEGAVFAAPANVAIAANATVSAGAVTNVQFFANSNFLGAAVTPPFGFTANNLSAGAYALTAVATASGISATSAVVNVNVVTPAAVTISGEGATGGQFSFAYNSSAGLGYIIQSSTNLANWLAISTNVASGTTSQFTDTAPVSGVRYYRVQLQPNP
jgi:plastocyanin